MKPRGPAPAHAVNGLALTVWFVLAPVPVVLWSFAGQWSWPAALPSVGG